MISFSFQVYRRTRAATAPSAIGTAYGSRMLLVARGSWWAERSRAIPATTGVNRRFATSVATAMNPPTMLV